MWITYLYFLRYFILFQEEAFSGAHTRVNSILVNSILLHIATRSTCMRLLVCECVWIVGRWQQRHPCVSSGVCAAHVVALDDAKQRQ